MTSMTSSHSCVFKAINSDLMQVTHVKFAGGNRKTTRSKVTMLQKRTNKEHYMHQATGRTARFTHSKNTEGSKVLKGSHEYDPHHAFFVYHPLSCTCHGQSVLEMSKFETLNISIKKFRKTYKRSKNSNRGHMTMIMTHLWEVYHLLSCIAAGHRDLLLTCLTAIKQQ